MMEKEDELDIVKKPYPGLHVFNASNCLGYYSLESMLENDFKISTTDKPVDFQLFPVVHNWVDDPEKWFYFMSVCPEEGFDISYVYWPHGKKFRVTVNDVVRVFLNWGATLETLGLESDKQFSSCFVPTQVPVTLDNFPAPHNVKVVLEGISHCLSEGEEEESDEQRYNLLKVLVVASLDVRLRQHRFRFNETICKVLKTFTIWTSDKVAELVNHLGLMRLGLQNAVYICCSMFTTSSRVQDFKVMAVRHLLHIKFGLCPPLEPIQALLEALLRIEKITEMFPLLDIYFLIQLLNTLLVLCFRNTFQPGVQGPECLPIIEGFFNWSRSVHNQLMTPVFIHTLEGGLIREKCGRLKADCVELMRPYKSSIF